MLLNICRLSSSPHSAWIYLVMDCNQIRVAGWKVSSVQILSAGPLNHPWECNAASRRARINYVNVLIFNLYDHRDNVGWGQIFKQCEAHVRRICILCQWHRVWVSIASYWVGLGRVFILETTFSTKWPPGWVSLWSNIYYLCGVSLWERAEVIVECGWPLWTPLCPISKRPNLTECLCDFSRRNGGLWLVFSESAARAGQFFMGGWMWPGYCGGRGWWVWMYKHKC